MPLDQIILFITGLTLLIFGMLRLSKSMQLILNLKIRNLIKRLVEKPSQGVFLGTIITALFQSSSASTVLTVGLVSAGLVSFVSSLAIVLGATIGSTIKAQLVALKVTKIAPIFIIAGILIWIFSKGQKNKKKIIGESLLYFGLLFFGLNIMGDAMNYFQDNAWFINLISTVQNPFIGLIIGFAFTSLVQSSAITTGILVLLGQQGLISIGAAIPIFLGANIGTTVTAILASIGSSIDARRTAYSHMIFKLVPAIVVLPFIGFFAKILKSLTSSIGAQISLGHLLFNIFLVILFFFWLKPFSKIMKKIIPGKSKLIPLWTEYLNKDYLNQPEKALRGVKKEMCRGIDLVTDMLNQAYDLTYDFEAKVVRDISYIEIVIDSLQIEVMDYLSKIEKDNLTKVQAKKIIYYSEIIDNIERISDHADNVTDLAKYKEESGVYFSKQAKKEFNNIISLLKESVSDTKKIIKKGEGEELIKKIFEREEQVNYLTEVAKENHADRFYKREVPVSDGTIFHDILVNLERISDHCINIACLYKK